MQQINAALESFRKDKLHHYATCWKITRRDGTIYRFTDHNATLNVVVDASLLYAAGNPYETFEAATGIGASAREREGDMAGANIEARGIVTSDKIKEADLEAGLFDGATVIEYLVDWRYPWIGPFFRVEYEIAEISYTAEVWNAQLEGFPRQLRQPVGDVYAKKERVKPTTVSTVSASVTLLGSPTRRVFQSSSGTLDTEGGAYDNGKIVWTSGDNTGVESVVRAMTNVGGGHPIKFELMLETPHDIQLSDDFDVSKAETFDAFPFLPGTGDVRTIIPVTRS